MGVSESKREGVNNNPSSMEISSGMRDLLVSKIQDKIRKAGLSLSSIPTQEVLAKEAQRNSSQLKNWTVINNNVLTLHVDQGAGSTYPDIVLALDDLEEKMLKIYSDNKVELYYNLVAMLFFDKSNNHQSKFDKYISEMKLQDPKIQDELNIIFDDATISFALVKAIVTNLAELQGSIDWNDELYNNLSNYKPVLYFFKSELSQCDMSDTRQVISCLQKALDGNNFQLNPEGLELEIWFRGILESYSVWKTECDELYADVLHLMKFLRNKAQGL